MTLTEAIASGKRFRRPRVAEWTTWQASETFKFLGEDLTAKDYEIEEKSAAVTRPLLLAACNAAGFAWGLNNPKFLLLCAALGL